MASPAFIIPDRLMISFFRRALSSWLVLGLLGLVMIAFVITGVATPDGMSLGGGESVAKVGGKQIGANEAASRVQLTLDQARREQPGLTTEAFVKDGGVDLTVRQIVAAKAMEVWAEMQGMAASDRLIDGEIASVAAFKGPTGAFDRQAMNAVLAQQRISEAQLRADMKGDLIRRQLLVPIMGASRVPAGLVTPYASLLLESRSGEIGIVPAQAMPAGKPPTEAEIADWYNRNIARYTMPERRILRYALFGADKLAAGAKPTDPEIAAFYKANAANYAAREARELSQVILPDEAAAKAFAATVKGGASFVQTAAKAGFTPGDISVGDQTRAQFAELASPAAATAAFALPEGGTSAPVKSELGWHVVHVDAIKGTPARPLAAVRDEIAAALEKQKLDEALSNLVSGIEDSISDGSSFEDVVKAHKLEATTTPPLLATGAAPDLPTWQAPPEIAMLIRPAFETTPDEDPMVETIAAGKQYALLGVTRILPAAPIPLAKVREAVVQDLMAKRASDRARAVATAIVAKANAGTPLAKAFAESGVKLPPLQRASGRQADLVQENRPVPPPLAMMFSMAKGKTKLLAAPDNAGWFVVHLDTITPGDATKAPGLIEATRGEFGRVVGQEYAEQFTNAVKKDVGVQINDAAVARLKSQFSGNTADAQ
jgi:peptidyl-prolyl cis-trans isomerase D